MSTYYRFYAGYRTVDDVLHLFGPYDKFNNLRPIIEVSRSFMSSAIYELNFINIDEKFMDDDVKKTFGYKGWNDNICYDIKYISPIDLPDTNFIKSGYYLLDEVIENIESDPYDVYFEEYYSPDEFSLRLQNAVTSNDTEELERLKKFVFYSYPDRTCKEYLSFLINNYIQWGGGFDEFYMKETLKEKGINDYKDMIIIIETC